MKNTLNNIELRRINSAPELRMEQELREDGNTQHYISGYAVVFEQYSLVAGDEFVEIISRNAFANTDMSDVVMVVDHSINAADILARSRNGKGTLEITVDEVGVKFRFAVPDTTVGNDIAKLIERGDISECSFGFWVKADEWRHINFDGKMIKERRIMEVAKLRDLSIVMRGAYPTTSVDIDERSLESAMREAQHPAPKATNMSVELAKAIASI